MDTKKEFIEQHKHAVMQATGENTYASRPLNQISLLMDTHDERRPGMDLLEYSATRLVTFDENSPNIAKYNMSSYFSLIGVSQEIFIMDKDLMELYHTFNEPSYIMHAIIDYSAHEELAQQLVYEYRDGVTWASEDVERREKDLTAAKVVCMTRENALKSQLEEKYPENSEIREVMNSFMDKVKSHMDFMMKSIAEVSAKAEAKINAHDNNAAQTSDSIKDDVDELYDYLQHLMNIEDGFAESLWLLARNYKIMSECLKEDNAQQLLKLAAGVMTENEMEEIPEDATLTAKSFYDSMSMVNQKLRGIEEPELPSEVRMSLSNAVRCRLTLAQDKAVLKYMPDLDILRTRRDDAHIHMLGTDEGKERDRYEDLYNRLNDLVEYYENYITTSTADKHELEEQIATERIYAYDEGDYRVSRDNTCISDMRDWARRLREQVATNSQEAGASHEEPAVEETVREEATVNQETATREEATTGEETTSSEQATAEGVEESLDESVEEAQTQETTAEPASEEQIAQTATEIVDLSAQLGQILEEEARLQVERQRLEERYSTHENSVMSHMRGQLDVYIPTDACGKLDDYVVDNRKIEGVGKTRVFFEKLTGGISTSRLSRRIEKHVDRFLYSNEISEETVRTTALSVNNAAGLFSDKFMDECRKYSIVRNGLFLDEYLGGNFASRLNLIKKISNSGSAEQTRAYLEEAKALIGEGFDGEVELSNDYFKRFTDAADTIMMYRLVRSIDVSSARALPEGIRKSLTDRIRAMQDNLGKLNTVLVNSPDYKYAKIRKKKSEVRARIDSQIANFNQYRRGLNPLTPDEGELGNPQAILARLRGETEAAIRRANATSGVTTQMEAYNRGATARIEASQDEEHYRERAAREISAAMAQATTEQLRKLAENKNKLLTEGIRKDGHQYANWRVGEYVDLVRSHLGNDFITLTYEELLNRLCTINENINQNLEHVSKYLEEKAGEDSDMTYLANEHLRAIAVNDIAKYMGRKFFTKRDYKAVSRMMNLSFKSFSMDNYKDAIKKAKSLISGVKELKGYEDGILKSDEAVDILLENDKAKVAAYLENCKSAVAINCGVIKEVVSQLSSTLRSDAYDTIVAHTHAEILSSTPDAIRLIAQREVEYFELEHPEVVERDGRVKTIAVANRSTQSAVRLLLKLNKDLATNGTEKQIADKLKEYEELIGRDDQYMEDLMDEQIEAISTEISKYYDYDSEEWSAMSTAKKYRYNLLSSAQSVMYNPDIITKIRATVREELEYRLATKLIAKLGIKSACKELLIETASEMSILSTLKQHYQDETDRAIEYEKYIMKNVVTDIATNGSLESDAQFIMQTIKEQMVADHVGGMKDISQLSEIKPMAVMDYVRLINNRLSMYTSLKGELMMYMQDKTTRQMVLKEMISGQTRSYKDWLSYVAARYSDILEAAEIVSAKKHIMAMGQNWTSHRAYVSIYDQRVNTSNKVEFRAINRKYRLHSMDDAFEEYAVEHSDTKPLTYYEFVADKITGITDVYDAKKLKKLHEDYSKYLDEWKGEDKERAKLVENLVKDKSVRGKYSNVAYYGMADKIDVMVRGLGEEINGASREEFEQKLEEKGIIYNLRMARFNRQCELHRVSEEDKNYLKENFRNNFVDSKADYDAAYKKASENRRLTTEEDRVLAAYDALETEFDKKLSLAITYVRTTNSWGVERSQYEVDEQDRMRSFAERKDRRFTKLSQADSGIYVPLLHVIADGHPFLDSLLGDKEEAYERKERQLMDNAREPMTILSAEKGVYHAYIDQFLIKYAEKIINGELKDKAVAEAEFAKEYKAITSYNLTGDPKNVISIDKILSDVLHIKDKEKARKEGNLLLMMVLYEGALDLANDKVREEYSRRLDQNSEVLKEELDRFKMTTEFKQYLELAGDADATGLAMKGKSRSDALEKSFEETVQMEEREYLLLTSHPESYRRQLRTRLTTLLTVCEEQTLTANQINRTSNIVKYHAQTIVDTKQKGREALDEERRNLEKYVEYADKRISPVMLANGRKKITSDMKKSEERIRKNVVASATTKSIAYDVVCAKLNESVASEDARTLCANIDKLIERTGCDVSKVSGRVAITRLAMNVRNPLLGISDSQLDELTGQYENELEVGRILEQIMVLKENLPKDGSLNSYYSDAVTRAAYKAYVTDREAAKKTLLRNFTAINNRILALEAIDSYISSHQSSLSEVEKKSLKAGLYELSAKEVANGKTVIDKEELVDSYIQLLSDRTTNRMVLSYLMSDKGGYGTGLSSETTVAEVSSFGAQMTRDSFEAMLVKNAKKPVVKEYFELTNEERILFGHFAACSQVCSVTNLSMSMEETIRVHSATSGEQNLEGIEEAFINAKPIGSVADYSQVSRSLFVRGKLQENTMKSALAMVAVMREKQVDKNLDMNILANSGETTIAMMGKNSPEPIHTMTQFKEMLSGYVDSDGLNPERTDLIERVNRLKPYELHMLMVVLSDRTALDKRTGKATYINQKRHDMLVKGIENSANSILAKASPGEALMHRAMVNLMSYQIRDDRVIRGLLSKDDLVDRDRNTNIDYALLASALNMLHA